MNLSTKKIARAGVVAALYTAATAAFGALAYGPLQIRPSEALTLLPLFYVESVAGLFVGCLLSNLIFGFGALDVIFGSLATLLSAALTYFAAKPIKRIGGKVAVGGAFPVLLNALVLPFIWKAAGDKAAFTVLFYPVLITQSLWIYLLGTPLILAISKMRQRQLPFFI